MKKSAFFTVLAIIVGLAALIDFSGCIFDVFGNSCGLFNHSSSYSSYFGYNKQFEPIETKVGESISIKPIEHVYIDYTYTGNPDCDGEDYSDVPYLEEVIIKNDSLATVEWYYVDYQDAIVKITGVEKGETELSMTFEWTNEGNDDFYTIYKTIDVPVTVY